MKQPKTSPCMAPLLVAGTGIFFLFVFVAFILVATTALKRHTYGTEERTAPPVVAYLVKSEGPTKCFDCEEQRVQLYQSYGNPKLYTGL